MISGEGPPLLRANVLADVLEALPRELRARKHEVALTVPFYREIRENPLVEIKETGITVDIRVGEKNHVAEFVESRTPGASRFFWCGAMSFSIATEFTANRANRTRTTPRVSFSSAKRRSNWRAE